MKIEAISIQSPFDQVKMYGTLYVEEKKAKKAFIVIFHGMSEHQLRYQEFATKLTEAGYVVLTCDHRGHGIHGEVKGFFAEKDGWERNVQDLHLLIQKGRENYSELPFYVFGHSMGSLFARSYLKRYEEEIDGVLICGTPNNNRLTKIGNLTAKVISAIFGKQHRSKLLHNMSVQAFNKVVKNPKTDSDWISVNEENVQNYLNDPESGFMFTAQGYVDLTTGIMDVYQDTSWVAKKKDIPIKFFSGEEDPCAGGEEGFQEAVSSLKERGYQNVTFKRYPGLRHEILNESNKEEVMQDMIDYFDSISKNRVKK